jgi:MOSC domain-containing protein YiiM
MDATTPRDLARFLEVVRAAPREVGRLERIVRRPAVDVREVVDVAELDVVRGLVGDNWLARGSKRIPDGSANPDAQVTLMSTRVLAAIEPDPERWSLAGDQLLVDFDLGLDALPAGSRLAIGSAVLEVTAQPHTGCAKFSARFGSDALRWTNSPEGRALRMRGMYARVVVGGLVRSGDLVRRA